MASLKDCVSAVHTISRGIGKVSVGMDCSEDHGSERSAGQAVRRSVFSRGIAIDGGDVRRQRRYFSVLATTDDGNPNVIAVVSIDEDRRRSRFRGIRGRNSNGRATEGHGTDDSRETHVVGRILSA